MTNPADQDALFTHETIQTPPDSLGELKEVSYEGDIDGGPFLNLYFANSVKFKVAQGNDLRSLVINVSGMDDKRACPATVSKPNHLMTSKLIYNSGVRGPVVSALILLIIISSSFMSIARAAGPDTAKGAKKGSSYAINLVSQLEPVDPERLPGLAAFEKYRLYTTRHMEDG